MPRQMFWPLNGRSGWQTATKLSHQVAVGDVIQLTAVSDGPLSLNDQADSLGRLLLPRGIAVADDGTIYLLGGKMPWWIKCLKQGAQKFEPIQSISTFVPESQKAKSECESGVDASDILAPMSITCLGRLLYLVANRRVLVFDRHTLTCRHRWEWDDWEPVDVAVDGCNAYILDRKYGRVWKHWPGSDLDPKRDVMIHKPGLAGCWERIGIDKNGRLYLKTVRRSLLPYSDAKNPIPSDCSADPVPKKTMKLIAGTQSPFLLVYTSKGERIERVTDAGAIRERFNPPAIIIDHKNRFQVPERSTYFTLEGKSIQVDPTEPVGSPIFKRTGRWISKRLDSNIYRCQWHRLEIDVPSLPAGTQITVRTYANQTSLTQEQLANLSDDLWETNFVMTGQMQPPPSNNADLKVSGQGSEHNPDQDMLIQSRHGQYLWLRIDIEGDGYDTPAIGGMRVHFPRSSYLAYLPAVYSADEESRWFLERFLSIMQTEWDDIEQRIERFAAYLDPHAVPAGPPMAFLAQWLALPLEGAWNAEQKRNLLTLAPTIYPHRGTVTALKKFVRVYLQNIAGISAENSSTFPQIVEGFQERQRLLLSQSKSAKLGLGAPLWGSQMVGRLQLDTNARADEVRLVSTGDPSRDVFHEYAHRFRVFVPSVWIKNREDERLLEQALGTEKPAHTKFDLCLVEPRFRIGYQSTVGIDTIIGNLPKARLACSHQHGEKPLNQPPRNRLGYDMVLAGHDLGKPGMQLTTHTRVGLDTVLT